MSQKSILSDIRNEGNDVVELRPVLVSRQSIRQDRIEGLQTSFCVVFNNVRHPLADYSAFGLAISSPQKMTELPSVISATLCCGEITLRELQLRPIRTEQLNGQYFTAFEIIDLPLKVEQLPAIELAHKVIEKKRVSLRTFDSIPFSFRQKVYEALLLMGQLEKEVNGISKDAPKDTYQELADFEQGVCHVVAGFLEKYLTRLYDDLTECLAKLPVKDRDLVLSFFREQLGSVLYQAPFARRSFNKPLGYAGDFEVMNLIYRDQPEGETIFAKSLHRYFINQPAAKAVRNRVDYVGDHFDSLLQRKTEGEIVRIMSMASGPAYELQQWLKRIGAFCKHRVEIVLVDQDLQSLKYAQRKLVEIVRGFKANIDISFINKNVRSVIARGTEQKDFDLVYSLGLFDYLSDSVCHAIAKQLYKSTAPGGMLIVGNFDVKNPTRNTMELALDWNLIYRSEEDLVRMYGDLGGRCWVDREPEGVNLFCVVKKPSIPDEKNRLS